MVFLLIVFFFFLNVTDSEQSILAIEDSQQNKPEVKQQDSPKEQSMEASSVANRGDDQEREDREKRKEAKVGGIFTSHTHYRANFPVSKQTMDVSSWIGHCITAVPHNSPQKKDNQAKRKQKGDPPASVN